MGVKRPEIVYLYIIGTDDGPSKVGYAADPEVRLKAIQREVKGYIVVTGQWPIGRRLALAVERYVHWQLRHHHIRGEWFNQPPAAIVSVIEASIARQGQMDPDKPIPPLDARGRAIRNPELMATKYPKGTAVRMDASLSDGEHRADLIREAVERELKRRERRA